LRPEGIFELLKRYPNQRFVDTLLSINRHGAHSGFEGTPTSHVRRPNHSSAFAHPNITASISNEIQKGRVKAIYPPSDTAFCSLLGVTVRLSEDVESNVNCVAKGGRR
jgi:hypothetical protein